MIGEEHLARFPPRDQVDLEPKVVAVNHHRTEELEAVATAADVFPRVLAQGYALAAMPDSSMRWLAIAVDRRFIDGPFLSQHAIFFEALPGLPQFQRLMGTVRDRWKKFESRSPGEGHTSTSISAYCFGS